MLDESLKRTSHDSHTDPSQQLTTSNQVDIRGKYAQKMLSMSHQLSTKQNDNDSQSRVLNDG